MPTLAKNARMGHPARTDTISLQMPVEAHPSFFVAPGSLEARIWRYTDLAKFLSLFDRSGLFFPRLDKLEILLKALSRNRYSSLKISNLTIYPTN